MITMTSYGFVSDETRGLGERFKPLDFFRSDWAAAAVALINAEPDARAKAPEEWERILKRLVTEAMKSGRWVGLRYEDFRKMSIDAYARELEGTPASPALAKAYTASELVNMRKAGYLFSDHYPVGSIVDEQGKPLPVDGGNIFFPTQKLLLRLQEFRRAKVKA